MVKYNASPHDFKSVSVCLCVLVWVYLWVCLYVSVCVCLAGSICGYVCVRVSVCVLLSLSVQILVQHDLEWKEPVLKCPDESPSYRCGALLLLPNGSTAIILSTFKVDAGTCESRNRESPTVSSLIRLLTFKRCSCDDVSVK